MDAVDERGGAGGAVCRTGSSSASNMSAFCASVIDSTGGVEGGWWNRSGVGFSFALDDPGKFSDHGGHFEAAFLIAMRLLDRSEQLADDVACAKKNVDILGGRASIALPEPVQERLGLVSDGGDVFHLEEAGAALDRVERAKDGVDHLVVHRAGGIGHTLEIDELRLGVIEHLHALRQKRLNQFAVLYEHTQIQLIPRDASRELCYGINTANSNGD